MTPKAWRNVVRRRKGCRGPHDEPPELKYVPECSIVTLHFHTNPAMLHGVIVVPCYNEAQRLNLPAMRRFVGTVAGLRMLMVNDGSSDGTAELLDQLAAETSGIQVLHLAANSGKAEAVRQGLLAACGESPDFVGFIDADLATPLEELPRFVEVLRRLPQVKVVLGLRLRLLGREIRRQRLRGLLGQVFAALASQVIGLKLQDTQCGAKLFRVNNPLRAALAQPFASRWIFDVELLARLKAAYAHDGLGDVARAVYELPLERWTEVPGSKLKRSDFIKAIVELAGIYRRYSWTKWPVPPAAEPMSQAVGSHSSGSTVSDREIHRAA